MEVVQKSRKSNPQAIISHQMYSGPIPPAAELAYYNRIVPMEILV